MSDATPRVFISYSQADWAEVAEIKEMLKELEVRYVSDAEISAGEDGGEAVQAALDNSDVFIACLSPSYLSSEWLNYELGTAIGRAADARTKLVPLLLQATTSPRILNQFHPIRADGETRAELQGHLGRALGVGRVEQSAPAMVAG